uniref:Uncharacterized protein n=1 Tax=Aegilops tauschii subsp. strangulata TaxID=200361 RepID=A0A453ED20_AEGTS
MSACMRLGRTDVCVLMCVLIWLFRLSSWFGCVRWCLRGLASIYRTMCCNESRLSFLQFRTLSH